MTTIPTRRLERSRESRMLFGIAGGIAEYLDTDPTLVRVLFLLALVALGPVAVLLYLLLALITPRAPREIVDGTGSW
jgi:phage shock protein C